MKELSVRLSSIENVKKFVSAIEFIDVDMNLKRGNVVIDAKSIIGILAMDLSQAFTLQIIGSEVNQREVIMAVKDFVIA